MKRITVFGSASPLPEQSPYEEAYRLGQLLGQSNFTVITGGYMGTMEAASKGASERSAHVIGVTCEEIEAFRPQGPNPWVKEEIRTKSLNDRLYQLMSLCEGALALPGGAGTLAEISLLWNLMIIKALPRKPLILIGAGWEETFKAMFNAQADNLSDYTNQYLFFAKDVDSAVKQLEEMLK
jgi:uncharacterized protein (TIGR00725 family)